MYLVKVSKYETQYIECQTRAAARAIAEDAIGLGAGENNVRIYETEEDQLRLVYDYSVK